MPPEIMPKTDIDKEMEHPTCIVCREPLSRRLDSRGQISEEFDAHTIIDPATTARLGPLCSLCKDDLDRKYDIYQGPERRRYQYPPGNLRAMVKLEALITEREGMVAENRIAELHGYALPYNEGAFVALADRFTNLLKTEYPSPSSDQFCKDHPSTHGCEACSHLAHCVCDDR